MKKTSACEADLQQLSKHLQKENVNHVPVFTEMLLKYVNDWTFINGLQNENMFVDMQLDMLWSCVFSNISNLYKQDSKTYKKLYEFINTNKKKLSDMFLMPDTL